MEWGVNGVFDTQNTLEVKGITEWHCYQWKKSSCEAVRKRIS